MYHNGSRGVKGEEMENKEMSLDDVIRNEKARFIERKNRCEEKLLAYPKGALVVRESGGRRYCYFKYRDGKKVITKYAGTFDKYGALNATVAEREKLTEEIRQLTSDIDRIERMEAVK